MNRAYEEFLVHDPQLQGPIPITHETASFPRPASAKACIFRFLTPEDAIRLLARAWYLACRRGYQRASQTCYCLALPPAGLREVVPLRSGFVFLNAQGLVSLWVDDSSCCHKEIQSKAEQERHPSEGLTLRTNAILFKFPCAFPLFIRPRSRSLSESTRQITPPTKNGHAPPPLVSRKSCQSVNRVQV